MSSAGFRAGRGDWRLVWSGIVRGARPANPRSPLPSNSKPMKHFPLILAAALALSATASAQTVILHEDFNAVPPAGWSQVKNNPIAQGWIKSLDNRAWHEDEFNVTCDDDLISPVLDCSAYATVSATFKTSLNWADYQANHPNSNGDGVSNIYIRVNGGAWSVAWTDTRISNTTDIITVDLTSLAAGQAGVEFAFHSFGPYAHEIWVDYLDITGGGAPPTLAKAGSCPGPMTLTASNCTASGQVALLYGGAGSFTKPGGQCAGLTLGISAPTLGAMVTANGSGVASLGINASAAACGLTIQGVDVATCTATNTITL